MAEIAGSVVYRQRIGLPPGSVVEVSIVDVTPGEADGVVLGRTEIATRGQQVPLPFHVQYDANAVEPGHRYQAQVRVTAAGRLRWVNDMAVPVLSGGPTDRVVVVVVPVRG